MGVWEVWPRIKSIKFQISGEKGGVGPNALSYHYCNSRVRRRLYTNTSRDLQRESNLERGWDHNILKWWLQALNNQVLQNQISLIDDHEDPLQIQHLKADSERDYAFSSPRVILLFIFCNDVALFFKLEAIDELEEWEWQVSASVPVMGVSYTQARQRPR